MESTFRYLTDILTGWRQYDLVNAGRCGDCEQPSPCKCRYCNCCSERWTSEANTPEPGDEEGRPRQNCPDCVAWLAEQAVSKMEIDGPVAS